MIFVGVDWAEAHHDVCVLDEAGVVLARKRIPDSLLGVSELHALVADHLSDDDDANDVIVGIEKDRGLIVTALVAANYQVFAVNPLAASRYRERHHVSGAKSDPGDAKVLADLVRTDRHNHRAVAGDSALSDAIKLLARTHQNTIWNRQRQVNTLRSALKDYYPGALEAFGTDLSGIDAVAILAIAPTPALGRGLSRSKITSALRRAGRKRYLEERTERIYEVLRREQLRQPTTLENAYGVTTETAIATIAQLNASLVKLEASLSEHFKQHPSAKVILSLPGMGTVLGARVLGEFGDDPNRYSDAKSRRNYAGTSPITRASGKSRVVLSRNARNKRLASALDQWAFSSLLPSPGARHYYDELKARDKHHRKAIRQLANKWVGILHA
ncbi:MAG TPA: IS110 family transposase, partial [Acidimicrobiales bacterium]